MENIEVHPDIASSFFRVSSDNKVLMNEEYEIVSTNLKSVGLKYRKEDNGRFNINRLLDDTEELVVNDLIPDYIFNEIKSVNTVNEIINKFGSDSFYRLSNESNDHRYSLDFYIPLIIKQTRSEPGYKKHNIIVNANPRFLYYYEGNQITRVEGILNIRNFTEGYFYDDIEREFNNINDLKIDNYNKFSIFEGVCMNTNAGMIISDNRDCTIDEPFVFYSSGYELVPYFVAEKGTVKYDIENTVNGLAKYNASKNKNLEYKITIKNVGNAASAGNVVTTYVPDGVTVNEKSINHSGVYNKANNSISWNTDYFDVGEVISLKYEALAPDSLNGKELVGYSTIGSDQIVGTTKSNDTIVTMDKIVEIVDNPKTGPTVYIANTNIGLPLSYILMLLVVLCVIVLFFVRKLIKAKRHN